MSDRFDHKLKHTLESTSDDDASSSVGTVRRIEMITGTGRRRRWSEAEKARIVIESLEPGANVSDVARRHGVSPQQVFGWRRQARDLFGDETSCAVQRQPSNTPPLPSKGDSRDAIPAFASVVVAASQQPAPADGGAPPPTRTDADGCIEIVAGDMIVRAFGHVDGATLVAVLRAVRRAS